MKSGILTGWNFFRVARLLLGIAALVQAIMLGEWLLAMAGLLIAGLAIANVGCGIGGCSTPASYSQKTNKPEEILYEEVAVKK
ncbi:MAG TPA: hypothetical protein VK907_10410 [Phnomibacter sp.]|nr:hypothetical protein [Phnomibacter sp.]